MDDSGFAFIIMVKGMKNFIHDQIRQHKGSFESSLGNQIAEFGVYGKTIHTFLYASDTRKRYIHMYYSAAKAAGERARLEENIQQMQRYLDANRNVKGSLVRRSKSTSSCIRIRTAACWSMRNQSFR